ncbi:MAG TPA: hypothetical protein DCY13_05080, partial [Verrucomicrobiales bacterium]|nr:hypothetical protein [Verrucomicrobiales bacterium]
MMRWTQVIWLSLAMLPPVGMASDATVPASAASTNAPATKSGKPDYFSTHSPRFEILLSDQALDALRVEPKEYVKATIREGGVLYTNVALKLKGARGSFRHVDDKPAFTLNFDKFADGQEFHGFDKLHLNNSVQDP